MRCVAVNVNLQTPERMILLTDAMNIMLELIDLFQKAKPNDENAATMNHVPTRTKTQNATVCRKNIAIGSTDKCNARIYNTNCSCFRETSFRKKEMLPRSKYLWIGKTADSPSKDSTPIIFFLWIHLQKR